MPVWPLLSLWHNARAVFRSNTTTMISRQRLRILVVEDNPSFNHLLELLLAQIGVEKYWFAHNFDTGLQLFQSEEPDLCLLDIELDGTDKTGIKLAEQIRLLKPQVPIVYLTSYYNEDYYHKTQHTRPNGFMSKEISQFKLEVAIDSALWVYEKPKEDFKPYVQEEQSKPLVISNNQFFFKIGDIYKSISVKEIKYFYADQKLTYARVGNRNFPTNVQLKVLEDEFQGYFARIHKTYLANIDFIESVHPKESVIVVGGETLPIGHAYRKQFFERLKLLR